MVFTIGHSTRSFEELRQLLLAHGIRRLVDVRTVPRSRHTPQFNREMVATRLAEAGVEYVHLPELGGLRKPRPDSPNTGWRNASFRGYADYMGTTEFEHGLVELIERASDAPTAVMCAEAVPWRCHRSMIADALLARGVEVRHVMSATRADLHRLTPWATVRRGRVVYGAGSGQRQSRLPDGGAAGSDDT